MTQKTELYANLVKRAYGYSMDEILSKTRDKDIVNARRAMAYLLREYSKYSYPKIGRVLERDHSSVMNLLKGYDPRDFLEAAGVDEDWIADKLANLNGSLSVKVAINSRWGHLFNERGATCEIPDCGFDDVVEIHHLIPTRLGGTNQNSNMLILCPNHHSYIHGGLIRFKKDAFPHLDIPEKLCTKTGDKVEILG
jgi:hypothetical protein